GYCPHFFVVSDLPAPSTSERTVAHSRWIEPAPRSRLSRRTVARGERSRLVIVGEKFSISPPTDDGAQSLLRVARIQMVLNLGLESHPRCEVTLALIEDMTDMGGERYKAEQMLAEEPLTFFRPALGEHAPSCGQLDSAVL